MPKGAGKGVGPGLQRQPKSFDAAAAADRASIAAVVLGYGFSSSILAIVNKWAVTVFPYPGLLTALQYTTCALVVASLGGAGLLQHDPLSLPMLRRFLPAAFVFYTAIFTNTKLLMHANVETFIVFRSSTPLLVALAESAFLKRPWPSRTTFASLLVILGGAVWYVATDQAFSVRAYAWAISYLMTITFEMVYVKHVVSSIGLNTWGLVYYNNLVSLFLSPAFLLISGEALQVFNVRKDTWLTLGTSTPVILSCGFGLAISFFGFACRKAVSATTFTVVGVTNKLLTVLINVVLWDKHASATGIAGLLTCVLGGVMYQQSISTKTPPRIHSSSTVGSLHAANDSKPPASHDPDLETADGVNSHSA